MQPLFIGPYEAGVQQNLKPFMIMDDAFPNMNNAFVFRGRVERKDGYYNLGRLTRTLVSVSAGTVSAGGAGNVTYFLSTGLGVSATQPNLQIQPGTVAHPITIVIGAPISQTLTDTTGTGVMTITGAGPITAAVLNYALGALVLTFSGAAAASSVTVSLSYYPTLPVMGISTRETSSLSTFQVNLFQTIFFDQVYAYQFGAGVFSEVPSTLPTTWHGSDTNFFCSTNYQQDSSDNDLFWVTNNNPGLHAYNVSLFAGEAAGPPSTVNVTAAGNTFQVGDLVYFAGLVGAGSPNNGTFGTVTVPGNPFTISNPGTAVFTNGAVSAGIAITPNRNISGDGIRYYNGTTWTNFNPLLNLFNVLCGCLMIVAYHGRLVCLSTIEGTDPTLANLFYNRQRARWSQNGPSFDPILGWRDDITGRGGFSDASTGEAIISCGFIKDQLIVYFERSTWQLVYTGNQLDPFEWQRINAELGADSTFSAVTFDNGLVAFGNVGVHSCNGVQTGRIDQQIPNEIYNIHQFTTNSSYDGPKRTTGVRNFLDECAYFAYATPVSDTSDPAKIFFPNKMMIYNYRNDTFSFFDDNATFLGYFQQPTNFTWNTITWTWDEWLSPWNSGLIEGGIPNICFGNQQGFIEIIDTNNVSQAPSLTIQAFSSGSIPGTIQVTSPQHNLFINQYVMISGCIGFTALNGLSFQIVLVVDANNFLINSNTSLSGYAGGGVLTVLSNINILSKMFTPFWTRGKRYNLRYMDILFDTTQAGEVNIDVFVDFCNQPDTSMTNSGPQGAIAPNVLLGNSVISTAPEGAPAAGQPVSPYYSLQKFGDQVWKRFYTWATGETFQIQITMNNTEMTTPAIQTSDIVVHAMIFYFDEAGEFY